jgi:hypothetical protein
MFPVRAVPGGWREWWDDPDDHAELRASAEATERRHPARAEYLGVVWHQELEQGSRAALDHWAV